MSEEKKSGRNLITEELEKLIKAIGKELSAIAKEDLLKNYIGICTYALELIEHTLGDNYDFPIDIDKIANELGIEVVYQPLNEDAEKTGVRMHKVVGRTLKRQNRITGKMEKYILIDEDSRINEQRYAMAHELAHYLIHYEDSAYYSQYCIMPMLFKGMEEMVADIFAIFLLVPLPIFLLEFYRYIGDHSVPVETSEWLKYLGIVADVPYENICIGYQNLRYVSSIICEISEEQRRRGSQTNEGYEDSSYLEEEQQCEDYSIRDKQVAKIIQILTDDMVNKLFC